MKPDSLPDRISHLGKVIAAHPLVPHDVDCAFAAVRELLLSGADLAERRESAALTQAQLAEAMGTTRQRIWNLEKTATPNPETIKAYLAAIERTRK
jgi:DNA-binding XRE family transcriptional regulator